MIGCDLCHLIRDSWSELRAGIGWGQIGKGEAMSWLLALGFICYALTPSVTGFGDEAFKVKWGREDGPSLSERRERRWTYVCTEKSGHS